MYLYIMGNNESEDAIFTIDEHKQIDCYVTTKEMYYMEKCRDRVKER